jgi:predicted DNA-binding transcriptional regulator YafY
LASDALATDISRQDHLVLGDVGSGDALSRSARLLALLQALRCRRHAVTAAALARELQVSERTIYRDLPELAAQGAPVHGEAGVGYMLRPGLFLPPLMLTEDETEAVLLGLRYVDQRGDDVLTKAAANAHAKILAVLPQERQVAATLPMTIPGPKDNGFPDNKVPLNALRSAIRTCRRLAISYVSGDGHQTQRVIWPIQLSFMDNARVVTGWCELRKAFRFFRTDRISSAEICDRYPARRADLIRDLCSIERRAWRRGSLLTGTDSRPCHMNGDGSHA